jgi:hypothetical protein
MNMFTLAIVAMLAAATSDAPASTPSVDRDQKIKCKSMEETGSLASRRKVCMTIAQWRQQARASQDVAEKMADTAICPSCQGH